ncbi:MAG: hypothetical protein ABW276_03705, partial [Casimicrobiaceae bacterium]
LGERYALVRDALTNSDGRCDEPLLEGASAPAATQGAGNNNANPAVPIANEVGKALGKLFGR